MQGIETKLVLWIVSDELVCFKHLIHLSKGYSAHFRLDYLPVKNKLSGTCCVALWCRYELQDPTLLLQYLSILLQYLSLLLQYLSLLLQYLSLLLQCLMHLAQGYGVHSRLDKSFDGIGRRYSMNVCMLVCIHMRAYIYVCMHTCTHIHVYIYMYSYTCIPSLYLA